MHDALRDALAVEMGNLFDELIVFQRSRAALAYAAQALVVTDRVPLTGCECFLFVSHSDFQA